MENVNKDKADVVSIILDDGDLLNAFADTLQVPVKKESRLQDISSNLKKYQGIKCYFLKSLKEFLMRLAHKVQVLAVLADYQFKRAQKQLRR